ncbi:Uncharacterised protein [Streptomyces griseus]|uniref:Uncharacterized protein n=1 Tax=Streptomyces griseus TaxID=1911 RepID=A0A380N916_STRGR|nr:Uncharacterised protein [Streptomyces griseus]
MTAWERAPSAPHPRGCSLGAGLDEVSVQVGPAPAGMLPDGRPPWPTTRPRTSSSAPHPRGCSYLHRYDKTAAWVGPAPAGMLPRRRRAGSRRRCRPRTRGDAPRREQPLRRHVRSAPHPRGCSRRPHLLREAPPVGPAPAGMLPRRSRAVEGGNRRPRTRGDAPPSAPWWRFRTPSAPHPRGCSSARSGAGATRPVGPAPAGMLPGPVSGDLDGLCRPRTRGDAPPGADVEATLLRSAPHPRGCSRTGLVVRPSGPVGPAPAGMLPAPSTHHRPSGRRPRTRGDAPCKQRMPQGGHMSAPHPRGCSLGAPAGRRPGRVGPAPAGMLPSRARSTGSSARRPRTRGDAPTSPLDGDTIRRSAPVPGDASTPCPRCHPAPEAAPRPCRCLSGGN